MSSVLQQVISAYPHTEKLKIKDVDRVTALVEALVEKGSEFLQVIADFDFTLTKFWLDDGGRGESGPGVMTYSPLMTEDFRTKCSELFNKYYPIEIDHTMTVEEKIPFMIEWYEKRRDIIVAAGITKTLVSDMVAVCKVALRDGANETLSRLNDAGVPVLVFSAGNGNVLEEVLKRDNALYPNLKIVSNFMKYDENERVVDYTNRTPIHTFNKNEHAVDSDYFNDLSHRNNALVLGDSLGDVSMTDGLQNPGSVLSIGFLNDKIEERLPSFLSSFDVVLLNDQTFDFVNLLVGHILKKQLKSQ